MKRIIKFRAWDLYLGQFIDPMLIGKLDFNDSTYVFQQFTGILGKGDKEIYEGDIVRTWRNSIQMALGVEKSPEYTKGQIEWWNEGWGVLQGLFGASRMSEYSDCDCHPCALEVIGNIFENPDLCK